MKKMFVLGLAVLLFAPPASAQEAGRRFGAGFFFDRSLPAMGLEDRYPAFGLKYGFGERDIRVDVAYSDGGSNFDAPLRISVGGSF